MQCVRVADGIRCAVGTGIVVSERVVNRVFTPESGRNQEVGANNRVSASAVNVEVLFHSNNTLALQT